MDVLASAIEYGLEGLVQCCVSYITDGLEVDTACEAIQAAITYNQDDLRDSCMTFIEANTREVFKSPHYAELSEDTLAWILQSDNLQADETEIYAAMREWGTVNMVVLEKPMAEVIKNVVEFVRFPLLSTDQLSKIEAENDKEKNIPVSDLSAETSALQICTRLWQFCITVSYHRASDALRRSLPAGSSACVLMHL